MAPELVEAMAATLSRKRMRLGEVLIEAGLATAMDIESALAEQKKRKGKKIGEILVEMKIVTEEHLTTTLAKKFHLRFANLDELRPNPLAAREVPRELIERYGFLPLDTDDKSYTVAISDPLFTEINDVLRFHLKRKLIHEVLVVSSQLERAVEAHLKRSDEDAGPEDHGGVDLILRELLADTPVAAAAEAEESAGLNESDSAIIKLANQIIIDAWRRGASDIHIEPNGAERPIVP